MTVIYILAALSTAAFVWAVSGWLLDEIGPRGKEDRAWAIKQVEARYQYLCSRTKDPAVLISLQVEHDEAIGRIKR